MTRLYYPGFTPQVRSPGRAKQASLHLADQYWCCAKVVAIFDLPDKKLGEIAA